MIPGGIFPTAILTNCRGYGLTGLALMVCLLACRPSESGRQKSGAGHAPPPEAGEEQTGNGQADAQPVQARDLQVVHHDGEGLVPEAGVLPVLINDQAVLVQPTGQYQTWYSASRRWGPVSLHDQAGAFRALYDIGGAGWFGLQADEISWFVAASGRAGRNRLAFDSPEAKLLGAGPDWIALLVEDHLNILQVAEERLRAWRLSEPWPGLRAVFPCSSGCAWLAWDGGGLFSTTALGEVWKPRQIGLNWPEEPLLALTMKAGLQEDRIVPEQILAVGESLDLYMLEPVETPDPEEFGWDQVADLSSDLCVPCHLDDGYQLRSTWTALKQTLLERLDPDRRDAKGAMPPAGTPWADQMTDEQIQHLLKPLKVATGFD